jgi:fatty-acyl-CoA synthase
MAHEESYRHRHLTVSHWPADTSRQLLDWTLGDALRHAATTAPERLALVEALADGTRGRCWTFSQLLNEADRVAAALLTRFRPGEHIAFWASNVPEWQLAFYGCALAGMVLVTVNPAYKARELDYVLRKSRATGLFTMDIYRGHDALAAIERIRAELPDLREVIRISGFDAFVASAHGPSILPSVLPHQNCVIMFTSGTTGAQKGVMFHHRGVVNMALFTQERGGLQPGGVYVNPMPMFHIGALGHAGVGGVMLMATHVLIAEWDARLFMTHAARERGTYSLLVPTMIEAVLTHPERSSFDISSLRNIVSGASVVEASLIRRTRAELGATICNIYGQTEMQGVVTAVHRDDTEADQAETIGQPLPQVEVIIADPETLSVMPLGQPGEICVRGYQTMIGYFGQPEATAAAITPDGFLRTGDLGTMDARGYCCITGRLKDMIIRGGMNLYPKEIEDVIFVHPKVSQIAVIGIPDDTWGEIVGAVVLPRDSAAPPSVDELYAWCRANLSPQKTPERWFFVQQYPLTSTGKIQKNVLVEWVRDNRISAQDWVKPQSRGTA